METFRAIAHIAVVHGWILHQFDIITAFLCRRLEPGEEVYNYMKQPKGFEESGLEEYIWEIQKGQYGLPWGLHVWNKAMNKGMSVISFRRIPCEYCLYIRDTESGSVLMVSMLTIFCCGLLHLANVYLQG